MISLSTFHGAAKDFTSAVGYNLRSQVLIERLQQGIIVSVGTTEFSAVLFRVIQVPEYVDCPGMQNTST
jgi:hypothetical protein